jgi:3-isopropylmalate/(R)-2-methylmalate dehydratase small subunit
MRFSSHAICILRENIDTDQIIPARFLKVTGKEGTGKCLFGNWRMNPDFILNQPSALGSRFLIAGDNFGCGSSREHAVWALVDFGFQAVVSTSFADIFKQNALKNGLLPIVVDAGTHQAIVRATSERSGTVFTADLAQQTLTSDSGISTVFPIDSFSKMCLLEKLDELGYILKHEAAIAAFEQNRETLPLQSQNGRS